MLLSIIAFSFRPKTYMSINVGCIVYLGSKSIRSKEVTESKLVHLYQNIMKKFQGR